MQATRVYQLTARWAQSEVVTLVTFSRVQNGVQYRTQLCALQVVHLAWIMIASSPTRTKLGHSFRCGMSAVLKHTAAPVMLEG